MPENSKGVSIMLRIVIVNETKEKALEMRDRVCSSLVGIPGFVNNEIVVSSQALDSSGNPTCEDGDMEWDGEKHCVLITLGSPNQPDDVPNMEFKIHGFHHDNVKMLRHVLKNTIC